MSNVFKCVECQAMTENGRSGVCAEVDEYECIDCGERYTGSKCPNAECGSNDRVVHKCGGHLEKIQASEVTEV